MVAAVLQELHRAWSGATVVTMESGAIADMADGGDVLLWLLLGVTATAIGIAVWQGRRAARCRRLAETARGDGAALHHHFFAANPQAMWIYDLETLRFLAVNDAAVARYGYSRDELATMTIADIRPPEDMQRLLDSVRSVTSGIDFAGAWRHRRKDGSLVDVEITSHTLEFQGRAAELVLAQDVTERLRTQEALRRSEERLALALHGTNDGLWDWNLETGEDYLSPRWKELLGFAPGELLDHEASFFDRLHAEDRPRVEEAVARHLQASAPYDIEFRLRNKAGDYRWFRSRAESMRDATGKAVRMVGTMTDISDRRSAQQALQRSNRALRAIRKCIQLIVRATSEQQLLDDVCRLMIEVGSYRLAWVGLAETDAARSVRVAAQAGLGSEYLESLRVTWADSDLGRGPTGTAIRERRVELARNIEDEALFEPWRTNALQHGLRSSIALPLLVDDTHCLGALNVYAAEPDAFDADEVQLLADLASDLAYGLRALRDRCAREQAEQELRATAVRLHHLLGASPTILYALRVQAGQLLPTEVSENVEQILGYPRSEILRPAWWRAHLHPEDRDRAVAAGNDLIAHRGGGHDYRFVHRDGHCIWVRDELRLVRDADGELAEVVGSWTDITERRQAEMGLRESEERLRLALRAASQGLYDLDVQTGVAKVSPEYAIMLGHDPEHFQETNAAWIARLHPDDKEPVAAVYRDYVAGRIPEYRVEFRQRTASGDWKWILSLGRIVERDAEGRPLRMLGTHTDITARKRAETERQQLQEQLLQAQKMESIGRLAGGVAHDFNNLLSVILGYTELAMRRLDPADPLRHNLEQIQAAGQRSAGLTRRLLAFARKLPVTPRVLDLNTTIAGMLDMLGRMIGEGIDLVWQPGRGLAPVEIDPAQVDQILANLVVNARDAMTGGGRLVIATANVSVEEHGLVDDPRLPAGDYVQLLVSDDGCGMDPDSMRLAFEPFYTTKGIGKGTGLGLATVYGIVRQNGGCVLLDSELGKGTTFRIYLPRSWRTSDSTPAPTASTLPRVGGETVLLVEDDAEVLQLARTMLEGLGYEVLVANSPAAALQLAGARHEAIDLLVTDLVMPGMSGRELAGRLAVARPATKILYMSGYPADVIGEAGLHDENLQLLQKPFTLAELAAKVRGALERG